MRNEDRIVVLESQLEQAREENSRLRASLGELDASIVQHMQAADKRGRAWHLERLVRAQAMSADAAGPRSCSGECCGQCEKVDAISVQPEPAPVLSDGLPLWPEVVQDWAKSYGILTRKSPLLESISDECMRLMAERDKFGQAKYGTSLRTNNGRDMLVDAVQESLDLLVYSRGMVQEEKCSDDRKEELAVLYNEAGRMLFLLVGFAMTKDWSAARLEKEMAHG